MKLLVLHPRNYALVLCLLVVYLIIYIVNSVNKLMEAPDGTTIDTSEKHMRELIEIYQKEKEMERLEKSFQTTTTTFKDLKSKVYHKNVNEIKFNGYVSDTKDIILDSTQDNPQVNLKAKNTGLERNKENYNYADNKNNLPHQSLLEEHHKIVNKSKSEEELPYSYDDFGNVLVNLGDMMDFRDKILQVTKMPPKHVEAYKSWEGAFYIEPYLMSRMMGLIDFECMYLRITPSTPICLYKAEEDVYVSAMIRYEGIWEGHIVSQLQRALSKHPEMGLIDLGANVGQYSLIAANMGHKVFAVEPYLPTLKRFQKAAQMGDLVPNIRVLQNAIADQRTTMYIHVNPDNAGDARAKTDNTSCKNCQTVKTILLSDIVPYLNFDKAVLKIDIQGYESVIFYYADHLFNTVHIPYIFMEWSLLREMYVTDMHTSTDKRDVEYLISYLTARGYTPYSSISGLSLNIGHWEGWPEDIYWVLSSASNDIFGYVLPRRRIKINES